MLDLSHIPNSQQDVQIFYANQGNFGYQTWRKPRKCNFVYILCIGAGAGGSSGYSTILNSSVGNSYSGASGAVNRCLINSSFVPDTLYIKVGKGSAGANNPTIGGSTIAFAQNGESSGVFCASNQPSQGNSNQGTSFIGGNTGAASGGNGGATSTTGNNHLIGLTNFISLGGKAGVTPLYSTTPPDINPLSSQIVTEGNGGANVNSTLNTPYDGGSIAASLISPRIKGGIGGSLVGGNGEDGYTSWKPFFSIGGAGGGNSYTSGGVAGNGGNGGIGSGGGGGGNANFGTAGKGGDGGDGIVIIISF